MVYTLASDASGRKPVRVQVPPSAPAFVRLRRTSAGRPSIVLTERRIGRPSFIKSNRKTLLSPLNLLINMIPSTQPNPQQTGDPGAHRRVGRNKRKHHPNASPSSFRGRVFRRPEMKKTSVPISKKYTLRIT